MLSKTSFIVALVLAITGLAACMGTTPAAWGQDPWQLLYTFTGAAAEDFLGQSVSGAGDVNNDGYDDLIVGAPYNDAGGDDAGRAYVFSGLDGDTLYIFTGDGAAAWDYFGESVSGAGDVNNDGYDDLIVGTYGAVNSGAGRAFVYSGQTGGLLWTFNGEAAWDHLGVSVSGAGDVDNDGYDDLIVGAPYNDAGGSNTGRAYVYSGQTGGVLWTFTGEAQGDYFGSSVSGAGDVNNDGYDDLIVGAHYNDAGGYDAGRAYVYSGQTGALLQTFTGDAESYCLGYSVSGAGDVNADGYDDVIVGVPAPSSPFPPYYSGWAHVYSGQTGALLQTFTGEAEQDEFGYSVSGAGDVNHDGYDDLIVGAPYSANSGRAYLYSGRTGAPLSTLEAQVAYESFGWSVSGAGDVNNDGYDDLIGGACWSDAGGYNAGRAYVYSGYNGRHVLLTAGPDISGFAGRDTAVKFFIQNTGVLNDVYDIDVTDSLGWNLNPLYYEVALDVWQVDSISFTVSIPNVPLGPTDRIFVTAVSQADTSARDSASLLVTCYAYGVLIEAVTDVGNDQGRQVHIDWSSFPGGDPLVTDFSIFRRKDSLLISVPDKSVIEAGLPVTYPPGQWEWLATIPAFGETLYSAVVPTLKDSTIAEGMYWSVFFVRAGTDNPTIHFDSPVDSGYSLDNLSPSPPGGLVASHEPAATVLGWTGSDDTDFDYYAIYRDTLSGFDPDASNRLGYTIDTSFTDSAAPLGRTFYYVVSATDFSGNESDPSGEASAARYIAGDANADGIINVADIVYLVNYLYRGGSEPSPVESGDATCDGVVNVADIVFLVNYLYRGGNPPAC